MPVNGDANAGSYPSARSRDRITALKYLQIFDISPQSYSHRKFPPSTCYYHRTRLATISMPHPSRGAGVAELAGGDSGRVARPRSGSPTNGSPGGRYAARSTYAVVNIALERQWRGSTDTLLEYRRAVTASICTFRSVSQNSGGLLFPSPSRFPIHPANSPSIR
ncbi:hypothetical protein EVAR_59693_1 [Eumeta japonica]|uniref:Uncharacterized protein n=1 Tax=Eumeta variegata TaxID=151549 RepID=A0A4C1Z197_EUMVA|nr:hypothetical protein EVAR_59693_1 [Eumeta japonica]